MFVHENAHLITAAETACDAESECSVRVRHESHIAERAVYGIVSTVAECDLQLSRHMDLTGNGEQVLCRRLRIWLHIECFALLNTGERAHHDISRVVSAAATAVDLAGNRFLHEDRNLLRL